MKKNYKNRVYDKMHEAAITYRQEILRKLVHLSSLWVVLACHFLPFIGTACLVLGVTAIVLLWDFFRFRLPALGSATETLIGNILRSHEKEQNENRRQKILCGASYFMIASSVTVIFFPKAIAITALLVLILSDTVAALIGRRWGKHKIGNKSLEGMLAFILSGWLVIGAVTALYSLPFSMVIAGICAVIAASLIEMFAEKCRVDDNLAIPLVCGMVMAAGML